MASSVDAKLLKSTKFPPEFSKKVDMQKVNLEVMKQCVSSSRNSSFGLTADGILGGSRKEWSRS
jgi:serine/arginine repetitive matrix protein 1